uniref:Oligoendopeptidase F n=1 Tax=Meloidogyne hapla TaxID=6305 RepID=A0A1I8BTW3_MELHA
MDTELFEIEPEKLVEEIIERFDRISNKSDDLTEKFKIISEETFAFLNLAVPLGDLLQNNLDIATKNESHEYKALKRLNEYLNYQLDRLSTRYYRYFDVEEMDYELRQFDNVWF